MTTRTASIGGLTWETAALWSGGVVPGAQDDAVLVAGASVGLTGRDTVNTLAIDNGASLSISGLLQATNGVVLAGTLTLAGTLQNTALTAFGNNATLVVAQATLTGTSQISVGFGATLALVKSDVNAYPQLGSTIHVASGTLDLTQYKGIPSFSVTMDDGAATLVVDGLNGGSIYGFRPGDAIDFATDAEDLGGVGIGHIGRRL